MDERCGAPHSLRKYLDRTLLTGGAGHRLGLPEPPRQQLGGRMVLRGDLRGGSAADPAGWSGKLYAELPRADVTEWRRHLPGSAGLRGGQVAARAWLDFRAQRVEALTADVRIANIAAKFQDDLPELDLAMLSGRVRYRIVGGGF